MKPKRLFVIGYLIGVVEKHEAQDEANEVSDEVSRITNDRDGMREYPTDNLSSDEDGTQYTYNDELGEAGLVVLLRRNLI